jgi:hypothetical protein
MSYTELKTAIKDIADIASGVPEHFRSKCFELLLAHLLSGIQPPETLRQHKQPVAERKSFKAPPARGELPVSTQLRVFMNKTKVEEEELKSVLMVADGDVHFIREPKSDKIAEGQREWALLLALKKAVLDNVLSVDPEDVRSVCQEKGYYDRANFAAIFKRPRIASLFKGSMEPQGEARQLTNKGVDELAKTIRALAAQR